MATTTVTASWAVDPNTVTCIVEQPDNVSSVYTYGVDAALTRTGIGQYSMAIPTNYPGTYQYQFAGTAQVPSGGSFTNLPTSTTLSNSATEGSRLGKLPNQLGRMQLGRAS